MEERLQKILAAAGVCSRRAAEKLILEGKVTVNGEKAQLGQSADPENDVICLDGKEITITGKKTYLMLHKPLGYVTTCSDEQGRRTVVELLEGVSARVVPVGRLDMYSSGLLLLTDDGELVNQLTHPAHEVWKEYRLRVRPAQTVFDAPEVLLSQPMEMDGVPLVPARVRTVAKEGNEHILSISIRQGKNRQIRRMCQMCGLKVLALQRVAVGDVRLGDLPVGKFRALTEREVQYLKETGKKK